VQHDRNSREEFVNFFRCAKSVQARHGVIQNYQIRTQLCRLRDCFPSIYGVATNLPTRIGFQDQPKFSLPIAADFDGDRKLDLAVLGDFAVQSGFCVGHHLDVVVLPGNGDGTFQAALTFISTDAANLILGAAAFDLNGDKTPDLVTVNNDNTLSVLLNAASTDFSISASTPNPDTVRRGQSSTSTVSLNLLNAFDNAVTLTCSVQPTQSAPTCSLDRDSVTFDANGHATSTLTISTAAAAASLVPSSTRHVWPAFRFSWLPIVGFAFMGVGFRLSIKRKLTVCLLGGILFSALILQVACGGGSGPRSQTYTIAVTGASGSTQHSTTTTLTVQ